MTEDQLTEIEARLTAVKERQGRQGIGPPYHVQEAGGGQHGYLIKTDRERYGVAVVVERAEAEMFARSQADLTALLDEVRRLREGLQPPQQAVRPCVMVSAGDDVSQVLWRAKVALREVKTDERIIAEMGHRAAHAFTAFGVRSLEIIGEYVELLGPDSPWNVVRAVADKLLAGGVTLEAANLTAYSPARLREELNGIGVRQCPLCREWFSGGHECKAAS